METFGAYARQFIGDMERPDVDKITGLSPVISIEQKTTNKNPRSTVGTITEVYDFLRLLFARTGEAYSYNTGKKMVKWSEEEIVENFSAILIADCKQRYAQKRGSTLGETSHQIRLVAGIKTQRVYQVRANQSSFEIVECCRCH